MFCRYASATQADAKILMEPVSDGSPLIRATMARVYIDGIYIATIDLYSRTTQYQVRVFERTGLTPGNHTLRIEYTGKRGTINIDVFEMIL